MINPSEAGVITDLVLARGDAAIDAMRRASTAGGSKTAAGACQALS